jgi:hypothetical protein
MNHTLTEIAATLRITFDTAALRLPRALRAIGDSGCAGRGQ